MLGTIVNNKQLVDLQKSGRVRIHPFDEKKIKTIHYPLTASKFFQCLGREGKEPKFGIKYDFELSAKKADFEPNEYMVVQIKQSITVDDGIIGHFIPSSKLVDYGFVLTCGRLEAPYGQNGEVIRFGIGNQLGIKNVIHKDEVLAYVYFIDLRALTSMKNEMSPEDKILFQRWQRKLVYAEDSGVHPIDDD